MISAWWPSYGPGRLVRSFAKTKKTFNRNKKRQDRSIKITQRISAWWPSCGPGRLAQLRPGGTQCTLGGTTAKHVQVQNMIHTSSAKHICLWSHYKTRGELIGIQAFGSSICIQEKNCARKSSHPAIISWESLLKRASTSHTLTGSGFYGRLSRSRPTIWDAQDRK